MDSDVSQPCVPIIDTHIHLYDPSRPQGVPWPSQNEPVLYQPALPERYAKLTRRFGVVGAIAVECSPWLEDNQWVLDVAKGNSGIVGFVGNLEPGKPGFRKQLEAFRQDPLFLGIRYGNLWGRDLGEKLSGKEFLADLQVLADADLVIDTAQPNPSLIADVVRLTDLIPKLRVVIDHLPQLETPDAHLVRNLLWASLRELGKRPQVYVKVSEVLRQVGGEVPLACSFYRTRLDELWEIFGEGRLLYGSDWPNSERWGTYEQVLSVVREYVAAKGKAAAEELFWKNSLKAYRWIARDDSQPKIREKAEVRGSVTNRT